MGFFDSFKSFTSGPALSESWEIPQDEEEIKALFKAGSGKVLIYKHSFSCSICTFSLLNLEKKITDISKDCRVVFIDVKASRPLSNLVASLSGVQHESPQAVLLVNGSVYWHGSHASVRSDAVLESLQEIEES
ncbi:MAG: bacillithiol system redox-active protein YtxJ [Balneolales bacterium]|nr:bacillithiol system redox-active protein YtxJ [Balneolales bacterium]